MRNRIMLLAISAFMAVGMISCGNPGKQPENFKLSVDNVDNYIESIGDYSSLKIESQEVSVSSEMVEKYAYLFFCEDAGQIDAWTARPGDQVVIDYVGRVDGKKFDGGSNENKVVTIGSHSLIEGFEEGLVGAKAGQSFELTLKFPEDYPMEEAGKDCVFAITVKKVIPAFDDEAVSFLNIPDCNDVNEYKVRSYETLIYHEERIRQEALVDKAIELLKENSSFKKFDDSLIAYSKDIFLEEYEAYGDNYGITSSAYVEYLGLNPDDEAYEQAMREVLLTKIASEQNLMEQISPEDENYRNELIKKVYAYLNDNMMVEATFGK